MKSKDCNHQTQKVKKKEKDQRDRSPNREKQKGVPWPKTEVTKKKNGNNERRLI